MQSLRSSGRAPRTRSGVGRQLASPDDSHYCSSDQFVPDDDTQISSLGADSSMPRPVPALIVDADPESRFYLRARLAIAGVLQADEAATGGEALYLLQSRSYRIVLLNVDLPDLDGWTLAAQVISKKNWPTLSASLVLIGEKMSWFGQLRGRFAGARSCMRKPLDPVKVAVLLRQLEA